jgi:hypothetical protein
MEITRPAMAAPRWAKRRDIPFEAKDQPEDRQDGTRQRQSEDDDARDHDAQLGARVVARPRCHGDDEEGRDRSRDAHQRADQRAAAQRRALLRHCLPVPAGRRRHGRRRPGAGRQSDRNARPTRVRGRLPQVRHPSPPRRLGGRTRAASRALSVDECAPPVERPGDPREPPPSGGRHDGGGPAVTRRSPPVSRG